MILQALAPLGAKHIITILPVYDGDKVTVSVLFKGKDKDAPTRQPLNVSGTIAEVDQWLQDELPKAAVEVAGLVSNLDKVKEQIAAEEKAAKDKKAADAATKTPAKKSVKKQASKTKEKDDVPQPPPPKAPKPDMSKAATATPSASSLKPAFAVSATPPPAAKPSDEIDLGFLS